jgi:hypothetical protein
LDQEFVWMVSQLAFIDKIWYIWDTLYTKKFLRILAQMLDMPDALIYRAKTTMTLWVTTQTNSSDDQAYLEQACQNKRETSLSTYCHNLYSNFFWNVLFLDPIYPTEVSLMQEVTSYHLHHTIPSHA